MLKTEDDIAKAITGAKGPLRIIGSGTRPIGRPGVGEVLSTAEHAGISLYEPGALTLVAKAGTSVEAIETALAAENQRLAFEPMDHRPLLGTKGTPTIGGIVAANVSGPRRFVVGACRDFLLGVRFVNGNGEVVKNGGRVMKNVTGYDLVKLMAGSYGTLGVLTEVSLKVLPMQDATTITVHGVTGIRALDAMTRATNSPFEVNGAAHLPADKGTVHLRIEGMDASRAYRAAELTKRLSDLGEISVDTDQDTNATLWKSLRDVSTLTKHQTVWRISMTPSAMMSGLLATLTQTATFDYQLDWAGGLCWLGMTDAQASATAGALDADQQTAIGGAMALHNALQSGVVNHGGGHVTLIKGSEALRKSVTVFQPEAAAIAAITRGLRDRFDPRGILNPGLMT